MSQVRIKDTSWKPDGNPQYSDGMGVGRKCIMVKKSEIWGRRSVGGLACCQIVIYRSNLVSAVFIYVAGKNRSWKPDGNPQCSDEMGAGRKCVMVKKSENWGRWSVEGLPCCQIVIYRSNLLSTVFIYVPGTSPSSKPDDSPHNGDRMEARRKCIMAKKPENWGKLSVVWLACLQIVIYRYSLLSTTFIYVRCMDKSWKQNGRPQYSVGMGAGRTYVMAKKSKNTYANNFWPQINCKTRKLVRFSAAL
jgi:hypothetical protein